MAKNGSYKYFIEELLDTFYNTSQISSCPYIPTIKHLTKLKQALKNLERTLKNY